MQIINFDQQFQRYMSRWIEKNGAKYLDNVDRMEEKMPEIYLQWLNQAADWLDGKTPGTYFAKYSDPAMLIAWLARYIDEKTPVPDQLLERIVDLGEVSSPQLLRVLEDAAAAQELRMLAVSLLSELDSRAPMALYIRTIAERDWEDAYADLASEALVAMGRCVVAPVLAAAESATDAGRETFLDVLCNFPGEDAIFQLALALFRAHPQKRALHASLMGKLADDRAIPLLLEAMGEQNLTYLDYIELRNALEALGAEAPPERAFDGDPYYESMRSMQQTD